MRTATICLTLFAALFVTNRLLAQDEVPAVDITVDTTPEPLAKPPPRPGEEIMVPTRHGIRLTPKLAKTMSKLWVREYLEDDKGFMLDDARRERLAEAGARQFMSVGHKHGEAGRDFIEFFYTSMMEGFISDQKLSPEKIMKLGKLGQAAMPALKELMGTVPPEFQDILNPEQLAELKADADRFNKAISKFEQKLDRWAKGERREDENIQDLFDDIENDFDDQEGAGNKEMRGIRRQAKWALYEVSPENWQQWLNQIRNIFDFSDEQYERAREILSDYQEMAKEIMADDWKEQARENRIRHALANHLDPGVQEPYRFGLQRKWDEMVAPLRDLERAFRSEVVGLITPEQRDKFFAVLRETGTKYELTPDEMFGDISEVIGRTETP